MCVLYFDGKRPREKRPQEGSETDDTGDTRHRRLKIVLTSKHVLDLNFFFLFFDVH